MWLGGTVRVDQKQHSHVLVTVNASEGKTEIVTPMLMIQYIAT